jgi:hypothetical protein
MDRKTCATGWSRWDFTEWSANHHQLASRRRKANKKEEQKRKRRAEQSAARTGREPTLLNLANGDATEALLDSSEEWRSTHRLQGNISFVGCAFVEDGPVTVLPGSNVAVFASIVAGQPIDALKLTTGSAEGARYAVAAVPKRAIASVSQSRRITLLQQQEQCATRVAEHLHTTTGVAYVVEVEKRQGDGVRGDPSIDALLIGPTGEIRLQIAQLSSDLAHQLGRSGMAIGIEVSPATIQEAIDAKQFLDLRGTHPTDLVLTFPAEIGEHLKSMLIPQTLNARGYNRVWLCGQPPVVIASGSLNMAAASPR